MRNVISVARLERRPAAIPFARVLTLALVLVAGLAACAHPSRRHAEHLDPASRQPTEYLDPASRQPTEYLDPASRQPTEYLDPDTAASVASVASPILFARAHQDVAANSREYATVVGASVNRAGRYEYVLLVYLWSTVDPRLGAGRHPGDNLILLADDRAIRLQRDGRSLRDVGIARPLDRQLHTRGPPRVYRIDRATLRFVAHAGRLRLQLEGDGDARPFDVWQDGRRELAQLADAAN
jgi:hypothetical protein